MFSNFVSEYSTEDAVELILSLLADAHGQLQYQPRKRRCDINFFRPSYSLEADYSLFKKVRKNIDFIVYEEV